MTLWKKRREREEEITRDAAFLRPMLETLGEDIRRPLALDGELLKSQLNSAGDPRRVPYPGWLKGAASAAAVLVVAVGAVLALRGQSALQSATGGDASSTAAATAGARDAAIPEMAADEGLAVFSLEGGSAPSFARSYEEVFARIQLIETEHPDTAQALDQSALQTPPDPAQGMGGGGGGGDAGGTAKQSAAGEAAADVSGTNLRVQGIEEADILKTDGEYLYYLSGATASRPSAELLIVQADGLTPVSSIDVGGGSTGELFVQGNMLALVTSESGLLTPSGETTLGSPQSVHDPDSAALPAQSTCIQLYDITDRAAPVLARTFSQEGEYVSSRLLSDSLYLVTERQTPSYRWLDSGSVPPEAVVPRVYDSALGKEAPLEPDHVLLPDGVGTTDYAVVSSLALSGGSVPAVTRAVLGGADVLYMSAQNLYITYPVYRAAEDGAAGKAAAQTGILKFSLRDAALPFIASAKIDGVLDSAYALDEYEGDLRAATTQHSGDDAGNHLFVLGPELAQRSEVRGLAPGESIRSVRYVGDTAYVVTFRETDPLFAIDLSDPDNAHVLGQLKVKGFSEYLHPLGDGFLLGVGSATRVTPGGATITDGIQLKVFDVTDPAHPKEADARTLGRRRSSSEVLFDPRAFLYRSSDGLFGIPAELFEVAGAENADPMQTAYAHAYSGFLLFAFEDGKLVEKGRVSHCPDLTRFDPSSDPIRRAVLVGETLYTVSGGTILASEVESLETTDTLSIP